MTVLSRFLSNIHNNALFSKADRLLLAFSGGVDSVVLASLLRAGGYEFALAHCNFKLRGEEAEADERFCREFAESLGVRFHVIQFDTEAYAKEHKLSIQVAARRLRYDWLKQLSKKEGYDSVLTAHHADDSIETFFVNLLRGTGAKGLQGIAMKQGRIARPLLFAFKQDIMNYAEEHQLRYRSDSSNAGTKYKRNAIRHQVIPKLRELSPAFGNTMLHNMQHLGESAEIVNELAKRKQDEICTVSDDTFRIDRRKLLQERHHSTWLFSWLQPFGFNASQLQQMLQCLEQAPATGKLFYSASHQLLIDREDLIVAPKDESTGESYTIASAGDVGRLPVSLRIELSEDPAVEAAPHIACLDADLVQFPLTLRHWREGDKFRPLGMAGFKKLSDYLTDEKVSRSGKQKAWVLESNNEVVWLVNHRIDDRFKLSSSTKKMMKIYYI